VETQIEIEKKKKDALQREILKKFAAELSSLLP